MIAVECPACRQGLNIPDEFAGQTGRCNYCGSVVRVPNQLSGGVPNSALSDLPFTAPRRPARPGAGMIANEEEHAGGAGSSLGRMLVFGIAALAVTACVLPAIVLGFSAETKPEAGTFREPSLPVVRGRNIPSVVAPPAETPVRVASPEPVQSPPIDEKRIVMVGATGGAYHQTGCGLVTAGARATTLGKALEEGLEACPDCND